MKKIGIVTYWSSNDNYGQILQCYALQKYLYFKGFDAFLIKYKPIEKVNILKKFEKKIVNNLSKDRIKYYFSSERKHHLAQIEREREIENRYKSVVGKCQFDEFRDRNIVSTIKVYSNISELRKDPPLADAYICGSDQVWNNDLYNKNSAGWFLDFGYARRISYAASIGRTLSTDEEIIFNNYLEKFYAISVREESAIEICHRLGYKNAQVTVDPTLLLTKSDYIKLTISNGLNWNKKVFLYVLNIDNKHDLHWEEIKEYADFRDLGIEICCSSGYICARELVENKQNLHLTVGEWLNALNNSTVVITSSFHGLVFCILFHTPFVAIPLVNKNVKANDRLNTLLELVGLKDRILTDKNSIKDIMEKSIDWNKVDELINSKKIESIMFLEKALERI